MVKKIAFVFSGQSSQYIGMGKELFDRYEIIRDTFLEASDNVSFDVTKVCFEGYNIDLTEYTQVAILTLSTAIDRLLKSFGIFPDILAGLSLGEYSALVSSGTINFTDAVRLVRQRGRIMQEYVKPGNWKMATIISKDIDAVCEICKKCKGEVYCTNYNSDNQIVITGKEQEVDKLCELLKKKTGIGRIIPLNVTLPFHTLELEDARINFNKELDKIKFGGFTVPVVKNIDGNIYTPDGVQEVLSSHMVSPIFFGKSVMTMLSNGTEVFIEVGPGKVLSNIIRRMDNRAEVYDTSDIKSIENIVNLYSCEVIK